MSAWTPCAEALPPMLPTDPWDWRAQSAWVLAKTERGEAFVARYWATTEEEDEPQTGWQQRGRDGYDMDDVASWCEVPA
ncbi:MAG: hypothetical protein M3Q51_03485 [Pseudomonadota bacterium]|nr:hypothetical protein [Pseudomonadota bacterium]MDQ3160069.1 hypothetical protein [Pseudomonadota bacterium]